MMMGIRDKNRMTLNETEFIDVLLFIIRCSYGLHLLIINKKIICQILSFKLPNARVSMLNKRQTPLFMMSKWLDFSNEKKQQQINDFEWYTFNFSCHLRTTSRPPWHFYCLMGLLKSVQCAANVTTKRQTHSTVNWSFCLFLASNVHHAIATEINVCFALELCFWKFHFQLHAMKFVSIPKSRNYPRKIKREQNANIQAIVSRHIITVHYASFANFTNKKRWINKEMLTTPTTKQFACQIFAK